MTRPLVAFGIAIVLVLSVILPMAPVRAQEPPRTDPSSVVPGEILVQFQPGTPGQAIADLHRQNGGQPTATIPGINVDIITVPVGEELSRAEAYRRNPNVIFAEVNGTVQEAGAPDDPRVGEQWQYNNTAQTGGTTDADIDSFESWTATTGSESIAIAILDTGLDSDHVDFLYGGVDNRQYSKIRKSINYTTSSTVEDVRGHGTHVAGTVAAGTNNGRGVAGTCPDCVLYNVKVLGDDGNGAWSWVASGITWAADNGASVINMSLSGSSGSSTLESAVNYAWSKGVVVVAAAGNGGTSTPAYPAAYTNTIAVASTDHKDVKASSSNYGSWVDVAAPGVNILSTTMGDTYGLKSGTSMASPHVAGIAGLVWSAGLCAPGDNTCVRARVEQTADRIAGTGTSWSRGRVNACQAVSGTCDSAAGTPPVVTIASPISGSAVSGSVVITINATGAEDAAGTLATEVSIDGSAWQRATSVGGTNYQLTWDATNASHGVHRISARATDSKRLTTFAAEVSVMVAKPVALPAAFEAENYRPGGQNVGYYDASAGNAGGTYRTDDVDIEPCTDPTTPAGATCYNVGWITRGEWLAYDVTVAETGRYTFTFRVATGNANTSFRIELMAEGASSFEDISGPVAIPSSGGWQNWSNVTTAALPISAGSYTLRLVADTSDPNLGYLFNLNSVTTTWATPVDNPPTVAITSPKDGDVVAASVPVIATASDDSGVAFVEFFAGTRSIGTDSDGNDGWSVTWDTTAVADGKTTLTAIAYDTANQTAMSTGIVVSIDNVNSPPTAALTVTCSALTCSFDGSGSTDPDGTIVSYAWAFGDGTTGSGTTTSRTYAEAGSYTVSLTVTDANDATATTSQTVAVSAPAPMMHVGDLDGIGTNARTSWSATATIVVHDGGHTPVTGSTVIGTWTGSTTVFRCTTDTSGVCRITSPSLSKKVASTTFTVTGLNHASLTYANVENHDPDGDSTGSSIKVLKP